MEHKLLKPGWAGMLTLEEAEYIQNELRQNVGLRRRWHIRGKRPRLATIAKKAFPEDPEAGRKYIESQQQSLTYRRNQFSGENHRSRVSDGKDEIKD